MAQTTTIHGIKFIHDGFSPNGSVILLVGDAEVRVPMRALMGFAAEVIRSHRISVLEQVSDAEILGIPEIR